MSKIVALAPVPAQIVSQWLLSQTGRPDIEVVSAEEVDSEQLATALREAEIVLGDYTFNRPVDAALLEAAPKLRFVQQPSVGYQHIDIEACRRRGVDVANTPGVNSVAVAEHTLMMALMLLKQAVYAHQQTTQGQWAQHELIWERGVHELKDKTFGIIGMGHVGRELASRLRPFEARLLYYDPQRLDADTERQLGVVFKPLDHLLRSADIVSLHVPLTDQTRGMIGAEQLDRMKFGAILINVARGECIDEQALAERLRKKKLGGAGIDVFGQEPIPADHPLLGLDNVVLTPHIAGATNEVRARVVQMAVGNIARVLRGEPPQYLVT